LINRHRGGDHGHAWGSPLFDGYLGVMPMYGDLAKLHGRSAAEHHGHQCLGVALGAGSFVARDASALNPARRNGKARAQAMTRAGPPS
jgi:hypothetical protein